jgi:hypothetical protein
VTELSLVPAIALKIDVTVNCSGHPGAPGVEQALACDRSNESAASPHAI